MAERRITLYFPRPLWRAWLITIAEVALIIAIYLTIRWLRGATGEADVASAIAIYALARTHYSRSSPTEIPDTTDRAKGG